LFDGFASLLGICDTASRQAEAAVLLEQCADDSCKLSYPLEASGHLISFRSLFENALKELKSKSPTAIMAAKFHNTLAKLIVEKVNQLSQETSIKQVVVSGGCFQNKLLTEQIQQLFVCHNISLYLPAQIPCNDGGVAVGQLAVAAARH
jgi:hydrogenase maturation protein HypF